MVAILFQLGNHRALRQCGQFRDAGRTAGELQVQQRIVRALLRCVLVRWRADLRQRKPAGAAAERRQLPLPVRPFGDRLGREDRAGAGVLRHRQQALMIDVHPVRAWVGQNDRHRTRVECAQEAGHQIVAMIERQQHHVRRIDALLAPRPSRSPGVREHVGEGGDALFLAVGVQEDQGASVRLFERVAVDGAQKRSAFRHPGSARRQETAPRACGASPA